MIRAQASACTVRPAFGASRQCLCEKFSHYPHRNARDRRIMNTCPRIPLPGLARRAASLSSWIPMRLKHKGLTWTRLHCDLYNAALEERIDAWRKAGKSIRARGRHRFGPDAQPNDITLTRRNGAWLVSVTLRVPEERCARQRTGDARRGVDFGVSDGATFDDGASDARVQSGRSWYAAAPERYAPTQTVAALLSVLGTRTQDPCRAHACLPALRARHATRPQQRVGGPHRRARSAPHAWNGRGGETQTPAPETGQVQVRDPRNPRDNAMRLAA